jgi:hypothetical protein
MAVNASLTLEGLKSPQDRPADLLLIAASFFGYAREIVNALEQRGRTVLWFEDRPAVDTATKATLRIAPGLLAKKADVYFEQIAERARAEAIRDVLVIKGEALSCAAIRSLRAALPAARFTLYFWDGYGNMPKDSSAKVPLFDRAFTFDPTDAATDRRLRYRPLFFLDAYANLPAAQPDIDLLFFGTAHGDRYTVLRRLSRVLPPEVRFEKVLYFPSQLIYATRRMLDPRLRGARRSEFIFKPLGKPDVLRLVSRARAVVDVERHVQTGLTMRTMETVGAGKKLVTTNSKVVEADFYDPDNIAVIDRKSPTLPAAFFERPYRSLPPPLLRRYSLSGWLEEVLGP